jgi:hypothetical protein
MMNEILLLKPNTDSSAGRFWPGIKCSPHLATTYFRKFLTFVSLFSDCSQYCELHPN